VSEDAEIEPRPIATLQLLSDDDIVTSPDDVMYGEDFESEVIAAGSLPAQAHAGKSSCTNQSFMKTALLTYCIYCIRKLKRCVTLTSNTF
jgi:hypothetical protein